jgi:putative ABC transport system permease protein
VTAPLAPPALPRTLLARALGPDNDARAIQGDLWEDFARVAAERGVRAARWWYWRAALALGASRGAQRLLRSLHLQRHGRSAMTETTGSLTSSGVSRDLRYALRAVRREPGFFILAVVIVGLGVGACTAVFSVMSPLMVRALPFRQPDRLVWIANDGNPRNGMSAVTSRTSNVRDFRRLSHSFLGLTGYNAFFGQGSYTLVGTGDPERLVGVDVAQDFLTVLGVSPLYGRSFTAEEGVGGDRPAVILTHRFWARRFNGDPSIVGTPINLNGVPTAVVGVLSPSFDFASIFAPGTRVDFLLPWPISDATDRSGNTTSMIARLKPGVTAEGAQAELNLIVAGLKQADPRRWGLGARVSGLSDHIAGPYRKAMLLLVAAAATVMLIVCVNLSNLLMAKASKRAKEMGVRRALGATRGRLVRQLLVESLVLALSGAVVGVAIAFGATRLVASSSGLSIPLLRTVSVDGTALLLSLGLAVTAGIAMGVVPALQATRFGERGALDDGTRGSSAGRHGARLREALVVAEVAMACVLLVVSGLFLRSLTNVLDVDLGFQPSHAVGWTLSSNRRFRSREEMNVFYDDLIARVEAVPGVQEAGLVDALPLGRNRTWGTLRQPGTVYDDDELQSAFPHIVDERYFSAMRIALLAGRDFTPQDTGDADSVIILNEAAARGAFRGEDPIGRTVLNAGRSWRVIGVVGDVRHVSLEQQSGWEMYYSFRQLADFQTLDLVVRSRLELAALVPGVAAALRASDPTMPTDEFRPLTGLVDRAVSPRRFILVLLTAFGGVALLLAALGIYGVLSYTVAERAPEIGIRMALGESAPQVRRRVVGRTFALAGSGIAIGVALSLAGTRSIGSLLYGVTPTDPVTFAAMMLVLLAIAMVAGFLPARRASRVDPSTALRAL